MSASLALLVFVTNAVLINGNMGIQATIQQRQLVINTAQNVQPLNSQLSNALYEASVKTNDDSIRALLVAQGFTLPSKADKANAAKVSDAKTPAKKSTDKVEE